MKILFLSPHVHLIDFIEFYGDVVHQTIDKIDAEFAKDFDWIISYGYRHILTKDILDSVNGNAINLHISFLPWNRGADPNFWSWIDDTPKGVTIHYIDHGIDTGNILFQRQVHMQLAETLETSYAKLTRAIEMMFETVWGHIRGGILIRMYSTEIGSYHNKKDKEKYMHLLTEGWNTPVINLIKGAEINE